MFRYSHCPRCGDWLEDREIDGRKRQVCRACGFVFYQNPTPAVAVILLKGDQVLLVKRKYEPKAGDWSLPAGFLEYDETVEETALREVKEETNLDIALDGIFGVYSGFEDPRAQVLLVVYRGMILSGELKPGDDAEEARFFPLDSFPANIAFRTHRQVLEQLRQERGAK